MAKAQQSDLTKLIMGLTQQNPFEYQQVMDRFIEASRRSDIEGMLALTSPITREKQGDDFLRKLYLEQYVLLFTEFLETSKGGENQLINRPTGERGWLFTRTLMSADGKNIPIYMIVLEENGKKYVARTGIRE
jgi:hypothetical protein